MLQKAVDNNEDSWGIRCEMRNGLKFLQHQYSLLCNKDAWSIAISREDQSTIHSKVSLLEEAPVFKQKCRFT